MKFQDLKTCMVPKGVEGVKSVMDRRPDGQTSQKQYATSTLFKWGHNNKAYLTS